MDAPNSCTWLAPAAPTSHTPELPLELPPTTTPPLPPLPPPPTLPPLSPGSGDNAVSSSQAQSLGIRPPSQSPVQMKRTGILKGTGPQLEADLGMKGTGILKGTGPQLDADLGHRPRPSVNYNLKELSYMSGTPSKDTGDAAETSLLDFQPAIQDPSTSSHEHQPAKRRRLEGYSTSPESMSPGDPWAIRFESSEGPPAALPSHFNTALTHHIWPVLLHGGITNPMVLLTLDFYRPFISLPKLRDIEWNPNTKRSKWTYRTKVDIVALLVQLTGTPAPQCCTKCDPPIGLFVGCIVTSLEAEARSYYGCANCLYHGTQTYCSLKYTSQQRGARCSQCHKAHAMCTQERPSCQKCLAHGHPCSYPEDTGIATGAPKPPRNGTGPEARPSRPPSLGVAERQDLNTSWEKAGTPTAKSAPDGDSSWRLAVSTTQPPSQHEEDVHFFGAAAWTNGGDTSDEASRLSEIPCMEKWERAPGRVRSQAPGQPKNIAFSKSYLASGVEVRVCREATFRVETIRSGHTHTFKADADVMRICSIATVTGKLNVKMDGEAPIVIGPHGMFTIRPRASCFVESETYEEVALHVTSVKVS